MEFLIGLNKFLAIKIFPPESPISPWGIPLWIDLPIHGEEIFNK